VAAVKTFLHISAHYAGCTPTFVLTQALFHLYKANQQVSFTNNKQTNKQTNK